MEVNEVFEKVKKLFVEELGIDSDKVTMESWLEEDLEIDSLGIVEVTMAFEDELGIEIKDDEIESIQVVREVVKDSDGKDVEEKDTTVQMLCDFLSTKS